MSDFGGKNVKNSISAGVPPQTPYGSLQQRASAGRAYSAPHDPWLHIRGPLICSQGSWGEALLLGEEKRKEKGREKRRVEKGVWAPKSSPQIDAPACNNKS